MRPAGCASLALAALVGAVACSHGSARETSGDPATASATTAATLATSAAPHHASALDDGGSLDAGAEDAGTSDAATSDAGPRLAPWAQKLTPLLFRDVNTVADVTLRLYKDDGTLDEAAALEAERVLWSAKDAEVPHMSRRLMQLVVKAAAHFDAHEVQVISSHRGKARKGSRHRTGEAIDFVFPGVPPKKLAEVLRTYPRVGVGVYIHPRSQFVHLDVREPSYHWIDSSPPGRTWREHGLADPTAAARDAAYEPEQDLPDGAI